MSIAGSRGGVSKSTKYRLRAEAGIRQRRFTDDEVRRLRQADATRLELCAEFPWADEKTILNVRAGRRYKRVPVDGLVAAPVVAEICRAAAPSMGGRLRRENTFVPARDGGSQ